MYVHDIKQFAKNEKKLENLIQVVRIYSEHIGNIWQRNIYSRE